MLSADDLIIAVIGIAAIGLVIGGGRMLRVPTADRRKAWLMVIAGALTGLNVYLWATMPDKPAGILPVGGTEESASGGGGSA